MDKGGNHCHRTEYRDKNEKKGNLRDLWDNIKCMNICIIGVPEGEKREKGPEKIYEELIGENLSNMGREIVYQVQEAESSRQNKPKEEHPKTHSNQTDRN